MAVRTLAFSLLVACTAPSTTDDKPVGTDTGDSAVDTDTDTEPDCTVEEMDLIRAFEKAIDGIAEPCEILAMDEFVAERLLDHGPWEQDIRMAFSEDARRFAPLDGVLIETAAVPEIVLDDDGRYWLFYVNGDFESAVDMAREGSLWMRTHGIPGLGALSAMVSDDGLNFEPVEDFAVEGIVRGMAVDPDIVRQPDGSWRMYYVGMTIGEYLTTAQWVYPEQHTVYWAVSDDLVHWRQQGEAVRGPYADPSVTCSMDDVCFMASYGLEWSRSTDGGVTFDYEGVWGVDGFAPEFVRFEDGVRRLYFNGAAKGAPLLSFFENGDMWELEEGERMPDDYGEAVTLARAEPSGWYMWYHTFKDPDDIPK